MFQFAGCPPRTLWIHVRVRKVRLTWVPPFRYLRINGYLPLPAAFRSLSRLSSACSAKASALCPSLLNHLCTPSVACRSFFGFPLACDSHRLAAVLLLPYHCTASASAPLFCFFFVSFILAWFDVFGSWFLVFSVFGFQGTSCAGLLPAVETERFELLTPCLQGRCSPN